MSDLLNDYEVNVGSGKLDQISEDAKKKLTISTTTESTLIALRNRIKGSVTIGQVVEIAIELLSKAQGKEIQIIDRSTGRIINTYFLWKE